MLRLWDVLLWNIYRVFLKSPYFLPRLFFANGLGRQGWRTIPFEKLLRFELIVSKIALGTCSRYYTRRETYLTVSVEVTHPSDTMRCLFWRTGEYGWQLQVGRWRPWFSQGRSVGPLDTYPEVQKSLQFWQVQMVSVHVRCFGKDSDYSRRFLHPPEPLAKPNVCINHSLSRVRALNRHSSLRLPFFDQQSGIPPSLPTLIVEAPEDTTKRMLETPQSKLFRLYSNYPDPSSRYNSGIYAGILWKKKFLLESRGDQASDEYFGWHNLVWHCWRPNPLCKLPF